jgi:hypothetical protein
MWTFIGVIDLFYHKKIVHHPKYTVQTILLLMMELLLQGTIWECEIHPNKMIVCEKKVAFRKLNHKIYSLI